MGCDIHAYVEYRSAELVTPGQKRYWQSFGEQFHPGRNYTMFGYLAGVRSAGPPVAEPRGRVLDPGDSVSHDDQIFVSDSGGRGCCTRETAEQWVNSGSSEYTGPDKKFVTSPDHHTHSWLTSDELKKAIEQSEIQIAQWYKEAGRNEKACEPEYRAILAAMKMLEECGCETRLVF